MSLLRRLSMSLQRGGEEQRSLGGRQHSFNDLSMGAATWEDDHHAHQQPDERQGPPLAASTPLAEPQRATPFGSAPAATGFLKSPALTIPRTSVAHILEQRLKMAESGTPRSSLDVPSAAFSTPRVSGISTAASTPSTPRAPAAADASEPASPRSPRTPGGRRRKSGKIDGMDYYEFCELIRASSL